MMSELENQISPGGRKKLEAFAEEYIEKAFHGDFMEAANHTVFIVISAFSQDNRPSNNTRNSQRRIDRLHDALIKLTDWDKAVLDNRIDKALVLNDLTSFHVCDRLIEVTSQPVPRGTKKQARQGLMWFAKKCVQSRWLDGETGAQTPLYKAVEILKDETGVPHSVYKLIYDQLY